MSFNRFMAAGMYGTVLAALFGSQALADTITVQSTPTVIEERSVVVPEPTVIEERHVVAPVLEERQVIAPIVEERQVVVPQTPIVEEHIVVPGDTVTKRTTLIESTGPRSTVSETVVKDSNPLPAFHRRLQLMRAQVSEGLSKGLMTSGTASALQARIDSLTAEADSVVANGTPKDLNDQLETRLNALNIDIADSMNHSEQIGSGSQLQ